MPRIHWKPLIALIVLAIGARWALQCRDAKTDPTPPALTHVDEQEPESESEDTAEPPDSTTVAEPSSDTAATRGALTFDHDPVEVKPRPEDEEITVSFE